MICIGNKAHLTNLIESKEPSIIIFTSPDKLMP